MSRGRSFVMLATFVAALVLPVGPALGARPAGRTCAISSTLRFDTVGVGVQCLETRLQALGYTGVVGPDRYFGLSTRKAVVAFQAANGLTIDGIVGPQTRSALNAVSGTVTGATPAVRTSFVPAKVIESRVIGTSVEGRPITADRMGTPGGRVVMLIGIIHGNETKGVLITQLLRTMPTPAGIDLWLIDSMNPDGVAAGTRENANGVDLNRNFETGWSYIPRSTVYHQYSGEQPADQPETRAVEDFIREVQPMIGIFYHQDANTISINGARHEIPTAYGVLVDLKPGTVSCSQLCTGTAGTFANKAVPGTTFFLVELPGSDQVNGAMVLRHAGALLAVATL